MQREEDDVPAAGPQPGHVAQQSSHVTCRWLKTPVEAENSDSEDAGDTSGLSASSSENGEGAECAGTSTRTYL